MAFDTESGGVLGAVWPGAVGAEATGGGGGALGTLVSPVGWNRDVACDPWGERVIAFVGDAEEQEGSVVACGWEAFAPGDSTGCIKQAWLSGIARVATSPHGTVVFQDSAGPRWKLLPRSGAFLPSAPAPRPMSLRSEGGLRWWGFAGGSGGANGQAPSLFGATVSEGGLSLGAPVATPLLPGPSEGLRSARWIGEGGRELILDAVEGDLMIATSAHAKPWGAWQRVELGLPISRIEQALRSEGGPVVALVSGEVDLVVLQMGDAGEVLCSATLDLPGAVIEQSLFFGRQALAVGAARWLVATTEGVFSVRATDACPLEVAREGSFAGRHLRGPIDACGARGAHEKR